MTINCNRRFALIINEPMLPSPFTVEISRRKDAHFVHVGMHGDNAKVCPIEMNATAESIATDTELCNHNRWVLKNASVHIVDEADPSVINNQQKTQDVVVNRSMEGEIAISKFQCTLSIFHIEFSLFLFSFSK